MQERGGRAHLEHRQLLHPYYETTLLTESTNPDKLYDIERMLEDYRIFGTDDVEAFTRVYFSEKGKQERLHAVLDAVVRKYRVHSQRPRSHP